jgi:tRNA threonylcarbamoyladenosine biosynthesis protein TsaB
MAELVSIAIETSCRLGGVALGLDDRVVRAIAFDASSRHTTHLLTRLKQMVESAGLRPGDLNELYVSAGPGSFTGVRVGVTVARTLGQAVPNLRLVRVPTAEAVAENFRDADWRHLGVVLDAKEEWVHATLFARRGERIEPEAPLGVARLAELLASAPRPLTLVGEGLFFRKPQELPMEGVSVPHPESLENHLPTAEGVWRVGRRMAREGQFTDFAHLLPIYARKPEAIRLWERRHGPVEGNAR